MDKVNVLIKTLEPEIELKCAEIRRRKNENLLTKIFAAVCTVLLTLPAVLIFCGVSVFTIFAPIIFSAAVLLTSSPFLINKGGRIYE